MSRLPPLRAPTADGALLAVPPLEHAGELIAANRDRVGGIALALLDRSWQEVRRLARQELLHQAHAYDPSVRGDSKPAKLDQPILLAGHQPELFHPGVWVKNFALAGLARRQHGVAVNLLVDNDAVKSTALLLPIPGNPWPKARMLLFDQWRGEVPWEERRVIDPDLFTRFGDDASALMDQWGIQSLLPDFWADVRQQLDLRGGLVGDSFAAARRRLERSWGCTNLELPLSRLCRGEAFACLAGVLIADLPRFVSVYNGALHEHRIQHHIRSRHHPVPNLAATGDWLELPLWGWKTALPRRQRLFARLLSDRVELRGSVEAWPTLPSPTRHPDRFLQAWRELESAGFKVRSRALITTLFARLFLADLFIHGIGGGKYDELTDVIISRFWRVPPPAFLVLSGTRLLPLPTYPATNEQRRRLERLLRDLHHNPQRHLPANRAAALSDLVRQKWDWIAQLPTMRSGRRERFHHLRQLNEALRSAVEDEIRDVSVRLARTEQELRGNALLRRRSFAFCLYPEATLRPFCTQLL